jgi:nicotinamidase-related amidase
MVPDMTTALLLIDAQRNMLEGDTPIPDAKRVRPELESLLARARAAAATVVHVQNDGSAGDPDEPHTAGWELVLAPVEGEVVVRKDQCDTFAANPTLASELHGSGVQRVIVAGMQSEYCVLETARAALGLGFDVVLAADAHGTYDGAASAADIAASVEEELGQAGARVLSSDGISFAVAV